MKINLNKGGGEQPQKPKNESVKRQQVSHNTRQISSQPEINMDELKASLIAEITSEMVKKDKITRDERIRRIEEREKAIEAIDQQEKVSQPEEKLKGRRKKSIPKTSPETNEDYFTNYKIKVRNQKVKKTIFTSIFYIFIAAMLVCNVYFIFIKKNKSIERTAAEVKYLINYTSFPKEGVEKYLEDNFQTLIDKNVKVSSSSGASNWTLNGINVRKVAAVTDSVANVFFSADISTNTSVAEHSFIISLTYDNTTKSYSPASDLISRTTLDEDSVKFEEENDKLWTFGEKPVKKDKDKINALSEFLNQFYTVLYNNKTYPSNTYLQTNNQINFDNTDYNFSYVDNVDWYETNNYMGMNCKVTYVVTSSEGLTYTMTSYMHVEESGDSFKITSLF